MQEDDRDIEEWAQRLAGKAARQDAESSAVRAAIAARDRADSEAAANDQLSQARLMKRLEAEGLLRDAPSPAKAPPRWQIWTRAAEASVQEGVSRTPPAKSRPSWHAWVGAAAAVLIAVVGVRLILPPTADYRGVAGSITIVSERPEATLAEVFAQLQALGLQPRRITVDGRVLIELDVAEAQLETFFDWAQPRGGRPVAAGRYRVFVEPGRP